jgi:hypothetical protein
MLLPFLIYFGFGSIIAIYLNYICNELSSEGNCEYKNLVLGVIYIISAIGFIPLVLRS